MAKTQPTKSSGLILTLQTGHTFEYNRSGRNEAHVEQMRHLRETFIQLEEQDQLTIEESVQDLCHHPRFDGYRLGPAGAFELLGKIGEFLVKKERGSDGSPSRVEIGD